MGNLNRYEAIVLPNSLEGAQLAVAEEFRRISGVINSIIDGNREMLYAEPVKLEDSMIVFADGTEWNPGHGQGFYARIGGEWLPLHNIGDATLVARTSVGPSSIVETEIYTITIPADTLHAGANIKQKIMGVYSNASASDDWIMRFKLGGVTLHTISRLGGNVTNVGWHAELFITVRTEGASGTVIEHVVLLDDTISYSSADTGEHAVDTTVAQTFSVTLQWANSKAGNVFHVDQGFTEMLH